MWGVLRFGSTAKRLHGESGVQASPPCGKTTPFQLSWGATNVGAPKLMVPARVVPPAEAQVCGATKNTVQAAVGFWPTLPAEPLGGALSIKYLPISWLYIMLNAPRRTVVPSPPTSQLKPRRGEKLVRTGFQREGVPDWPC